MVTRIECEKHYKNLGVPTETNTLDMLVSNVERHSRDVEKRCIDSTHRAFHAIKNQDRGFITADGENAYEFFDLEEGQLEYLEEEYEDKLQECKKASTINTVKAKEAKEFLKHYHTTCATNAACADAYKVLGMAKGGAVSDVRAIYKKISRIYHPDLCKNVKGGICDDAKYCAINNAKEFLTDAKNKCDQIVNLQDFFQLSEVGVSPQENDTDL